MEGQTIKCPLCQEPYVFMPYYAGDQSACPDCRAKARAGRRKLQEPNPGIAEAYRKIVSEYGMIGGVQPVDVTARTVALTKD